jgi:hypothetical protein
MEDPKKRGSPDSKLKSREPMLKMSDLKFAGLFFSISGAT